MHKQIRVGTGLMISVNAREPVRTHGMGYFDPGGYAAAQSIS